MTSKISCLDYAPIKEIEAQEGYRKDREEVYGGRKTFRLLFGGEEDTTLAVAIKNSKNPERYSRLFDWIDSFFYVPLRMQSENGKEEQIVKVNINSLCKRLFISSKKFKKAIKESSLERLVEKRLAFIKENHCLSPV